MIKQVIFSMRHALGQEDQKWSVKDEVERNKVITKINIIVFSLKYVWNLGDRLESDLVEKTTIEARHKYCLL